VYHYIKEERESTTHKDKRFRDYMCCCEE